MVPALAVGVAAGAVASPAHPLMAVVASPGVRSWADLAGRRVGVNAPTSLGAAGIRGRLEAEGTAPAELVEVPFTNMGLGVRSGFVDAAVMVDPFLTQSLARGDGRVLGWVVGGPPMSDVEAAVWTVRRPLLAGGQVALRRYLDALLDSLAWVDAEPGGARSVLAARLSLAPGVAEQLRLPLVADGARSRPSLLQAMADALTPEGAPPVDAGRLVDGGPLDAVARDR